MKIPRGEIPPNPPFSKGGTRVEARCFASLLLLLAACGAPRPASDADKRQRIAEMYQGYKESFADVPDITVDELLALGDDVVVVDVREERERRVSMIPGALAKEVFEGNAEAYGGRRVVAYCTVGYRSGRYTAELRRRGWDALNLEGSLLAWTHAAQPLVDEDGETRRLHVYGKEWDLAAEGYETVW